MSHFGSFNHIYGIMTTQTLQGIDAIKSKIEKLLRLAEKAGTEEEAATAMAMAQELMTRYKIDVSILDTENQQQIKNDSIVSDFVVGDNKEQAMGKVATWKCYLVGALAEANNSKYFYIPKTGIKIVGFESDVQIVKYLYPFFARQIDQLTLLNARGKGGNYCANYRLGVVYTVKEKLMKAKNSAMQTAYRDAHVTNNPNALVKLDSAIADLRNKEKQVQAFYGRLGLRNSSGQRKNNRDAFEDDRRDGQSINTNNSSRGSLGTGQKKIG